MVSLRKFCSRSRKQGDYNIIQAPAFDPGLQFLGTSIIEILQDASRYVEPLTSDTASALPHPNLSHATKDERIAIAFGRSLHNATRPHRNRFSAIANPREALSEDDSSDAGGFSTPPRATRKSASAGAVSDPNEEVAANGEDFDDQEEEGEEDEDLEEDE